MDYPKSVPNVGLVGGQFVDENTTTGQVGSLIPASWGNAVTQEILAVIAAAGLAPDEQNVHQLVAAVKALSASDFKRSVRAATTGAIALSGLQQIDGVQLVAGDRVLVKDQANAAQNWIYIAAGGAWLRAPDASEGAVCTPGHLVGVQAGTVGAGSLWQLSNTEFPVLGTTALAFRKLVTDAYTKGQTYSQQEINALLQGLNAMPLGTTVAFCVEAAPAGFLELDGNLYSATAYPDLAAHLGTRYNKAGDPAGYFRVPDARGEFLRGWDHGRGVDAGRTLGSAQAATALRQWSMDLNGAALGTAGGLSFADADSYNQPAPSTTRLPDGTLLSAKPENIKDDFVRGASGDQVSGNVNNYLTVRPRSLAVLWCIKAWNAPVNQGNIDVAALAATVVQATEVKQGTARVATQVQTEAGDSDDVIVTPKKLRLGFSASFAANGYVAFPKWLGGLIVQWGYYGGGAHWPTVTYPLAFPSACFVVLGTSAADNGSVAIAGVPTVTQFSATQLDHTTSNSNSSTPFYWFALGR